MDPDIALSQTIQADPRRLAPRRLILRRASRIACFGLGIQGRVRDSLWALLRTAISSPSIQAQASTWVKSWSAET